MTPIPVLLAVALAAPAGEPPDGRGLLIAAGVTAGVGVVLSGVGFGAFVYAENYKRDSPLNMSGFPESPGSRLGVAGISIGLTALVAAIPLFILGKRWQNAWENSVQRVAVRPRFARTSHGAWTAGFVLRF